LSPANKSWTAAGISVVDHITAATDLDRYVAAALMLMAAFGLRFKEACMVRPHRDVLERTADAAVTYCLDTHRGTKGGRERFVPIASDTQRQAIEFAKAVAMKPDDSVSDPHLTLKQALRRARYVMERLGITKRDLGVCRTACGINMRQSGIRNWPALRRL
jgi:integrase